MSLSSNPPYNSQQPRNPHPEPFGYEPYAGHSSSLPALPPIQSEVLESVAFTHPGFYIGNTVSKLDTTYDRLEFLGDAYIEVIATRLVYTSFPHLTAGRLSQQREMCVKNETLAEYAVAYGFDKKARIPGEIRNQGGKIWTKTLGDIFEAYVAAAILSDPGNGFQIVEAWLTSLWTVKLNPQSSNPSSGTQMANLDGKTQLAKKVLGKGVKLDYKEIKRSEQIRSQGKILFHIGVSITGWGWTNQHLGSGTGLSKQEAGANAAVEAIKNPMSDKIAAVKKEFDAQVAKARAGVEGSQSISPK